MSSLQNTETEVAKRTFWSPWPERVTDREGEKREQERASDLKEAREEKYVRVCSHQRER